MFLLCNPPCNPPNVFPTNRLVKRVFQTLCNGTADFIDNGVVSFVARPDCENCSIAIEVGSCYCQTGEMMMF
jgi:hypothetical protein